MQHPNITGLTKQTQKSPNTHLLRGVEQKEQEGHLLLPNPEVTCSLRVSSHSPRAPTRSCALSSVEPKAIVGSVFIAILPPQNRRLSEACFNESTLVSKRVNDKINHLRFGVCSHEIKRCLLLGRKVTTNLDSILKSRDIILPTKVHLVKAMVFPVVLYGCESWTIKKAEH